MILLDVNILVYAVRVDAPEHVRTVEWLSRTLTGPEPVLVARESLGAVVRIVTHRHIWAKPLAHEIAFAFVHRLLATPSVSVIVAGPSHWAVFEQLCIAADARGNLVTDAWIAALAIENHATLITTDRDVARFPGLRWKHPLAS